MCDYSLQHIASRPARVGDKVVVSQFSGTATRGFAVVNEPDVAVCILPGTELVFDQDVKYEPAIAFFPKRNARQRLARFRRLNEDRPATHHDALEFSDGKTVLVTRLRTGQHATVLQLPAGSRVAAATSQDEPIVAGGQTVRQ
jgi:hypothetical protein